MGLELLYRGYFMVPQKKSFDGETSYLNVVAKNTPMFYATESIAAYEQFAKRIKDQKGGSPDKVQCLTLKDTNHREFELAKTTFADAVKILDTNESWGFIYLVQDGRGLMLSGRMVRELSRRYSILQEQAFVKSQQEQMDKYNKRAQLERASTQTQPHSQDYSQPTHQPRPQQPQNNNNNRTAASTSKSAYQSADTVKSNDTLKKNFKLMLEILSNIDAFDMWSSRDIYAIAYVMDRMYNSGDINYYKSNMNMWARMAREENVQAKTLAVLIMNEIIRVMSIDNNASDMDRNIAHRECAATKKRADDDTSIIHLGIIPQNCVPKWCVSEVNEYAKRKKAEVHDRFIKSCVEEGMNDAVAQKYFDLLSENNKRATLELDYCLKNNKFKKYGALLLPDPKTGERMTMEEMCKRRNPSFQAQTPNFKKTIITGYIRAAEADLKSKQ
jgi:hypothetical protein